MPYDPNLFSGGGAPSPGFGGVATRDQYGLSPLAYKLLNTIAGTESPGYDVMYGGRRFSSYADHPRVSVPIGTGPNAGRTSSAAGRYQFLASTWDQMARELGLKDFSPHNQDIAAWHLAKTAYSRNTGRDLERDLADPSQLGRIASSLSGTWTSLPGGIEAANGGQSRFSRAFQNAAEYGGASPSGAADYGIASPQIGPPAAQPRPAPDAMAGIADTLASNLRKQNAPGGTSGFQSMGRKAPTPVANAFSQNLILSS